MATENISKKILVSKLIGTKTIPNGALIRALSNIWRQVDWKMQRLDNEIMSFFFQTEEGCAVLKSGRPWNVNGILLNLVEWSRNGQWMEIDFSEAALWVQIVGLPFPFHTATNAVKIA